MAAVAFCWMRPVPDSGPAHLVDQCGKANPRNTAEIIVVGILTSDTLVRSSVPKHSNPIYPLQLRRLHVRVENVLKGDLTAATVDVYYFTFAGGFEGNQPLGMWEPGCRRILWLRRDSDVLRTACDGFDYCTLGVYSGAHPPSGLTRGDRWITLSPTSC